MVPFAAAASCLECVPQLRSLGLAEIVPPQGSHPRACAFRVHAWLAVCLSDAPRAPAEAQMWVAVLEAAPQKQKRLLWSTQAL